MDFSTLQGLTIPEGVVTQITKDGVVLWVLNTGGDTVILEVEKITSDTYAGETTYTGEQFILLDIYPKTNGTVNITYGGLTKTITDTSGVANPNAQQVLFGTFNGVSDSVATPTSGRLTIEGDYYAFCCSSYTKKTSSKTTTEYCSCIKEIIRFGDNIIRIPTNAFYNCKGITNAKMPNGVRHIGNRAFYGCSGIKDLEIPNSVTGIGAQAFYGCSGIKDLEIPNSVKSISNEAFMSCSFESVTFENTLGWEVSSVSDFSGTIIPVDVSDPINNATLLTSTDAYMHYYWRCS